MVNLKRVIVHLTSTFYNAHECQKTEHQPKTSPVNKARTGAIMKINAGHYCNLRG